jgi:Ca2+-binding EF-hand superfamily protein
MKLKSILVIGTFLGGASFAQAGDKSFGDGTLPEFLVQYDVNEDGQIDEEERQAIKEARKAAREARRAEIDTDGDGEISKDEREAARDAIRAAIEAKRAEKFAEIAGDDGLLSLEELAAVPHLENAPEEMIAAIFARLDADESGDVSLEEFNARLRPHRRHDGPRNGNGNSRPKDHNRGPGHREEGGE